MVPAVEAARRESPEAALASELVQFCRSIAGKSKSFRVIEPEIMLTDPANGAYVKLTWMSRVSLDGNEREQLADCLEQVAQELRGAM